jgi:hypothetical protein
MSLGKRIQVRAISFSDGGPLGGDAFCAENGARSRFVLHFGASGRVALAGFLAISLMAGVTLDSSLRASASGTWERRLVSPSPVACAHRVAEGGDLGSHPASQGAPGWGSHCQTAPGS